MRLAARLRRRDRLAVVILACVPFALAQVAPQSKPFAGELAALERKLETFEQEQSDRLDAATTEDEQRKILAQDPVQLFGQEFLDLGLKAKGSEVAPRALLSVIRLENRMSSMAEPKGAAGAPVTPAQRALDALVLDNLDSPLLLELPELLQNTLELGAARCETALRKLRAGSPHRPVQASALYALAAHLVERAGDDAAKRAEARASYVDLKEHFADQSDARGRSYAKLADGYLFELDHLAIGKVAPDFEAVDQDGATWKLSDYRGKVVVLDFWGFW